MMNLDPIKQAVKWLEAEQRHEDDDCGDPKCGECEVRRTRQALIDGLKLLHDSLTMASRESKV